jgi:pimeloyl-ACP methyl ester carboxylesterase
MRIREYGGSGFPVVLVHGGPGAPGSMAPIARGLADSFRVFEPLQRASGEEPLTVARHVADLHELIVSRCPSPRPALVGHSWGAMLALALAAEHPQDAGSLVLIGCGTFDPESRRRFHADFAARIDDEARRRFEQLEVDVPDANQRMRARGDLILPLYSYDLVSHDQEVIECDARGHHETWHDMLRLQQSGVYPAAFAAIKAPVLMLHGAADPHPGPMIRESLAPFLPQLEYREWERCGHSPWLERAVRQEFFAALREWLERTSGRAASQKEKGKRQK